MTKGRIDVSIIIITYNHVKYVSQAIDSVMRQKHNLQIEILLIDDASTDGTVEVLKEYEKESNLQNIKFMFNDINSCHPTKNVYKLCNMAKGKYVTFLEGDDYWIDEYKLQTQYEFLENNLSFCAYAGNVQTVNEKAENIENLKFYTPLEKNVYTLDDFKTLQMPAMLGGFFVRNIFGKMDSTILYTADKYMCDITIFMLALLMGNIYQSPKVMSAYRYVNVKGENNFNSINKENKYKEYNCLRYWMRLEKYIEKNYKKNYNIDIIKHGIIAYGKKYSKRAMFSVLKESRKIQYYIIYILSNWIVYYNNNIETKKCKNKWKEFQNDSAPTIIFGAGNVASIYMDLYSWKNEILFLVDNNVNIQNKSYKGYLVKDPQEIKKYKSNCKILIANEKYEMEIAKQLMDMGVSNFYFFCAMQSERKLNKLLKIVYNL